MKKKLAFMVTFITILFCFSLFSHAQSQTRGEIGGHVADEEGETLPGVSVKLTGKSLFERSLAVVTNEQGNFRFRNVVPGIYEIEFTLPGYNVLKQTHIPVHAGATSPVRAILTVMTIEEEVVVVSSAPLIETQTAQFTTTIENVIIENIPVARTLSTFVGLMNTAPGITDNLAYGSVGAVESSDVSYGSYTSGYRFDGVDVSNPRVGYTSVNPIYETIQEFQIVGIGASAEHGNFVGASINIIGKSGSNEFHGSITTRYNDDRLRSDNSEGFSQLAPQEFNYDVDTTFTLSGPLIREKLFFLIAGGYAGNEKKWPIFTEYQTLNRYRGYTKLDWLIDGKNQVTAMFNANPCFITNTGLMRGYDPSTAANYELSAMNTMMATWRSILSEDTFFHLTFAGWNEEYRYYPRYPGVPFWGNTATSTYHGSNMTDNTQRSHSLEGNFALTHYAEKLFGTSHEIKLGLEYHYSQLTEDRSYPGGGYMFSYPSGATNTLWYAYTGGESHTQGMINRFTSYIQDNLRIGRKLSLNLGLRLENVRVSARDFPGNVASFNNLAPRLGVTYDITGDAKNVLRATFGIYYNKVMLNTYRQCLPGRDDLYIYATILPTVALDPTEENLKNQLALIAQLKNLTSISAYSIPMVVDPDKKRTRADVYSLGYSRQLGSLFALSIDYTFKQDRNAYMFKSFTEHTYEEFQWTDPWLGNTITLWQQKDREPDIDRLFTNSDWPKASHHFVMLTLRKRPTRNWAMMFSYVYQNTKSNYMRGSDLGGFPAWNFDADPIFYANPLWWGRDRDREHQFKLLGTYFGPFGINISGNLQALSGTPWATTTHSSRVTGPEVPTDPFGRRTLYRSTGGITIPIEPRGIYRTDFNWNFDLRFAKAFKIKRSHLELQVDVLNLFNNQQYTSVIMTPYTIYPGTTQNAYGKPWRLDPPRNIYMGVTWRF